MISNAIRDPLGIDFGAILDRAKNWSKIGLKSDQDANVKVFKTLGGANVFGDLGRSKINQKQTKIVFKAILS